MRSLLAHSFALAALLVLTGEAAALKDVKASSCMSRSEAKKAYRGAYLYWHRNAEGQRCWSTRRVKSVSAAAARRAAPDRHASRTESAPAAPAPQPLPVVPRQLLWPQHPAAPLPIPPEATRAQSISDFSPWNWTTEAYAGTPDAQAAPPPQPTPVNREAKGDRLGRSTLTVDAVMALIAAWLICFMVGTTLYRWVRQRDALRIGA